MEHYFTNSTE